MSRLVISWPSAPARSGGGWRRHGRVYQIGLVTMDRQAQPAADCLARETVEAVTAKTRRFTPAAFFCNSRHMSEPAR
jgi:hypothetical protein